jgi:hypothetical protein
MKALLVTARFIPMLFVSMTACSKETNKAIHKKEYSFETAKKNGDVIFREGDVYNTRDMDAFIHKYKDGFVRFTQFDENNEPVIKDLTINKDAKPHRIYYDVDYSLTSEKGRDGEEISHTQCKSITKVEHANSIDYILEGCGAITDTELLFTVPKD